MGREPSNKPVRILHIGRIDSGHETLWQQLQHEGMSITFAATQKAGLEKAAELEPQLVIINGSNALFSPDRVCRGLSRRLPNVRRLVLLDRASEEEVPCDLCLVRPFTVRKLRASLFQLINDAAPHVIEAGPLQLDMVAKTVSGPAGQHHLTPKQCSLLAIFMERPNHVVSRKDLMDQIWETDYLGDTRTLDVHIRWLRQKIELDAEHPVLLVTRRGVGYVLALPQPEAVASPQPDEVLELD